MYNLTQLLVSILPLCTYRDIETNGSWMFPKVLPHKAATWDSCPSTQIYARSQKYTGDDRKKFSCRGQNLIAADFKTNGCHFLKLDQSMKAIASTHKNVVYVGDSLMRQIYMASMCSGEHSHTINRSHIHLITDLFLRSDIPCDSRCAGDPELRAQKKLVHPCWACRDNGIKQDFGNYLNDAKAWHHQLPPTDIAAIVMGSGAWYNVFKGIINSTDTYAETLRAVGPILQSLKTNRDIDVFWVGLPPHTFNLSTTNASTYGYEWIYFAEKDAIAKQILTPYGVVFVDTNVLTKPRKLRDPYIAADGLHWCNPGVDAIPTFLNRIIFHLIAMRRALNSTV